MGISGLLPLLKDIHQHGHISAFKGQRLAVDAYVWLHRGAYACAEDLVKGKETVKYVDYAMHRVRLLRHFGIIPYIVFDGGPLPAKKCTESSRAKSRAENLARSQALESQGRGRDARDLYTKCVDITPEMAYQLIKALRAERVDYVVAPYEADAQMCLLEKEGYVDGIITEDSDLLVFGCKQVIFKLDVNGQCMSIKRDQLATVRDFPMHGWTDVQFRRMAMLSGCDYLPSLNGMGLKTAHRLLRRFKTVEKVLQHVRLEGTMQVPSDYITKFAQAELAFLHQRAFHPGLQRMVPLNDFPEDGLAEEDQQWVGLDFPPDVARGMAAGDLHPETQEPIQDIAPTFTPSAKVTSMSKLVLGESTKINVGVGPMDAFISRTMPTKRRKSAPLPTPVGASGSGPSRLSAQVSAPAILEDAGPIPVKKSKFFGGRGTETCELEAVIQAEAANLTWEKSDETLPDLDEETPAAGPSRPRSPSPDIRSPSPIVSSLRFDTSPGRPAFEDEPQSARSGFSSPIALSSPVCSSPHRDVAFSSSPGSPVPKRRSAPASYLVAPTSQPQPSHTQSIDSSQLFDLDTPPFRRGQIKRGTLIPDSSPYHGATATIPESQPARKRRRGQASSDSLADDEVVVTPSGQMLGKQRKSSEELRDEEEDREREERAKIVAKGWKEKYTLKSSLAFPAPGSTRTTPKTGTAMGLKRPKSDPAERATAWPEKRPALATVPANIVVSEPIPPSDHAKKREDKENGGCPKAAAATTPMGKLNPLDKYRFTFKVQAKRDIL